MSKKAIISGINGQDGIFLSKILTAYGYEVFGLSSQDSPSLHLDSIIRYIPCDIRNTSKVLDICDEFAIEYFFNLAALSSVVQSFEHEELTKEVNFIAPKMIIEGFFSMQNEERRFFQASSSEMFGLAHTEPQNENTPLNPLSPYANWKAEMHSYCEALRAKGNFISCAIMYNHESIYRPRKFLSKKVAQSVAARYLNLEYKLTLGNVDSQRDWGFAGDYMEAAFRMMKFDTPETFVIATGKCRSVLDMVKVALDSVDLGSSIENFFAIDLELFRPREAMRLVGDPTKAQDLLAWRPRKSFNSMISEMVQFEIEQFASNTNYKFNSAKE